MLTEKVIAHFGGKQQTADALGIKYQSVQGWGVYPPDGRQFQIQLLTKGKLVAEANQPAPKKTSSEPTAQKSARL